MLRANKHSNVILQSSYNKYGQDAFEYAILEECSVERLLEREQYYLNTIPNLYNIAMIAGSPMAGKEHTEEVKQALREKLSGNKHPHYGKSPTEEHRWNIARTKKRFSDEEEMDFLRRYEDGERKKDIAASVGVHITTITRAINRAKRFTAFMV